MKKERNSRHRGRTSRSEMPVRAVFRSAAMVLAAAVLSAMSAFAQESVSEVATEAAMEAEEEASRPVYRALDYVELGQYTGLPVSVEPVTVTEDDIEQAISDALAEAFADYINESGIQDENGNVLTLETSEEGIYQAGSYYEYLKGVRSDLSLNAVPNLKLGER